jgi:hypothetical protein
MNMQSFRVIQPTNVQRANRPKSKTLILSAAMAVFAVLPSSVA